MNEQAERAAGREMRARAPVRKYGHRRVSGGGCAADARQFHFIYLMSLLKWRYRQRCCPLLLRPAGVC
jgi:hypothetical protein